MSESAVERIIESHIRRVQAAGVVIRASVSGLDYSTMSGAIYTLDNKGPCELCALEAVLWGRRRGESVENDLQASLGRGRSWQSGFMYGFDGDTSDHIRNTEFEEGWNLGRKFRDKYITGREV